MLIPPPSVPYFHPPPAHEGGVVGLQFPIGHSLEQTGSQNVYSECLWFLKIETWHMYPTFSEPPAEAGTNLGPRIAGRNNPNIFPGINKEYRSGQLHLETLLSSSIFQKCR